MSSDTPLHDDEGAVAPDLPPDPSRRLWVATACAMGSVAGIATLVPFVSTFSPSTKTRAAGAPVEVDISDIPAGQMRTVEWRGKPVWILHRDDKQLVGLKEQDPFLADPHSNRPGYTPDYAKNEYRSRKSDLFVCIGLCTHLGCSPTANFNAGGGGILPASWEGGFVCPCHGSTFDMAGRVYKNKPAPDNLEIPPYQYLSETRIVIGIDEDNNA